MQLIVIAHNIRSIYNVGTIFRTADAFGVRTLHLTGYTPYPTIENDTRPPHIRQAMTRQLHKTALGAELSVPFTYQEAPGELIRQYQHRGFHIAALEQADHSVTLASYTAPEQLVLILGEERHGITADILALCDDVLEIPMLGKKESLNVSVATGIALYALTNSRKITRQNPSARAY